MHICIDFEFHSSVLGAFYKGAWLHKAWRFMFFWILCLDFFHIFFVFQCHYDLHTFSKPLHMDVRCKMHICIDFEFHSTVLGALYKSVWFHKKWNFFFNIFFSYFFFWHLSFIYFIFLCHYDLHNFFKTVHMDGKSKVHICIDFYFYSSVLGAFYKVAGLH